MIRRNITRFLIRFLSACVFTASVLYVAGPYYTQVFLPIFSIQIEYMDPDLQVTEATIIQIGQIRYIQFLIKVNKPSPPGYQVPGELGNITRHKGQASALVIAPLMIFSLIVAWPSLTIRRRLQTFIFSIPLIVLLQCLDFPMIFISNIASVFCPDSPLNTVRSVWVHILNNGGRQFLAVIGFFLLIAPYYLKSQMPPSEETSAGKKPLHKNTPCSCGSGKKYKNCCGKNLKIDQKK